MMKGAKRKNKEFGIYEAFLIAFCFHILIFFLGAYFPNKISKIVYGPMPIKERKMQKPLEFTFVEVPEKKIEIMRKKPAPLLSDKDRVAAERPRNYDQEALPIPQMEGASKNLIINKALTPEEKRDNDVIEKRAEKTEIPNKTEEGEGIISEEKSLRAINPKKLAESLRNLDKYLPNELLNNPKSSYEAEAPPDNELWLDTQGVDLGPWAKKVYIRVRNNWIIPLAAKLGFKGKVSIDFEVLRDGTVQNLLIKTPSGIMSFDQAALNALAMSNPLPPLPEVYPKPLLKGRFTFYYNITPDEK